MKTTLEQRIQGLEKLLEIKIAAYDQDGVPIYTQCIPSTNMFTGEPLQ